MDSAKIAVLYLSLDCLWIVFAKIKNFQMFDIL